MHDKSLIKIIAGRLITTGVNYGSMTPYGLTGEYLQLEEKQLSDRSLCTN